MEDFTKIYFRKYIIISFLFLAFFLVLMLIFIDLEEYISSIPWAIICVGIIVIICFQFRTYLVYSHDVNVLEGTITNVVIGWRSYQMVIKCDERNYVASYDFFFIPIITSHIKEKAGRKCFFVVNKRGKAYIKYFS